MTMGLMDINPATTGTAGGFRKPFSPPGLKIGYFLRFLAKVGHAYATAEVGHGKFQPFLTNFIRAKDDRLPWGLIGGTGTGPTSKQDRWKGLHLEPYFIDHGLHVASGSTYVFVDIRVLARVPFPSYRVVVGELNRSLS